jgi:hypothetical protein
VFIVVSIYFIIYSVWKLLDKPSYNSHSNQLPAEVPTEVVEMYWLLKCAAYVIDCDRLVTSNGVMNDRKMEKICSSLTLFTINRDLTAIGLNLGLCNEELMSDFLNLTTNHHNSTST